MSTDLDSAVAETPGTTDAEATAQDNQFVTFAVANEMFAVQMAPVQEIIRVPEVARLPLAPAALDGLANLRGRVLPIMNLRRLFNTAERANDDATRALVINLGTPLGFVVDRVASVLNIEPSEIEPARAIQSVVQADYLTGVINRPGADGQRQLMLVLDFDRLVNDQFNQRGMREITHSGAGLHNEATALGAEGRGEGPGNADELRLVSFTVCEQEYAIDIADVQEIVQVPEGITAVPNTPHHVLGLISLRQRLLPLVSLRSLFGLAPQTLDEHHRIVVVALPGGAQVGLVTDTVKEVLSVPRSQADAVPGALSRDGELQEFESICRLDEGRRLVSIIATDKLLGMRAIQEAAGLADHPDHHQESTMADAHSQALSSDDDTQVVIFRLGAEEFGVPIMTVQEIVRVPEVLTKVPKTPKFVEGVINLRGTVLPVVDQRSRFGMDNIERNDRQRIMVYTLNGLRTGFIVDSVAEVLRIPRHSIEPAPELSDEQGRLITKVAKLDNDKRLVMLIDPSQLLGARESSAVEKMFNNAPDASTLAKAA
jgi:purine-binding chemotaxis protein CheW